MVDYIVDESKFLLEDEQEEHLFDSEFTLPCGITVSQLEDCSDKWELYLSDDGKHCILAVFKDLYDKWIASGLLKASDFQVVNVKGKDVYLLFSRSSHRLCRLTNVRIGRSTRYALSLFSAFMNTRSHDLESNLRDGIYFERKSIILPTYSLVGKVSDRALYDNALRAPNEPEKLTVPDGLNDSLSYPYIRRLLNQKNFAVISEEPLLQIGEMAEDFLCKKDPFSLITGPLIIREHYQLFDTNSDSYILLIDSLWGEALIAANLLNQISLSTIVISGKKHFFFAVSKKDAIENMNDRQFMILKEDAFDIAHSIKTTRSIVPKADLSDGLYIKSLGLILPLAFNTENYGQDAGIIQDCLSRGPFACGPFLDSVNEELILITQQNH
ncbi:MAG: hypothetical protein ACI4UM_00720 [Succinivibrio sp.]